jgi:putative transposase
MPRMPRIDIPGVPQHLMVRGHNRLPCFYEEADRRVFMKYLDFAASRSDCAVHAYVLMTNHVHLLATGPAGGCISRMMHSLNRRYSRYVNRAYGRTGALFDSRFKSSLVDSESYFLTCMRYIELNPVRAGMVRHPADYPWSSFRENASGAPQGWIKPHDEYLRLSADPGERGFAYRALFSLPIGAADLEAIRAGAMHDRVLGGESFQKRVEEWLSRPVGPGKRGRPKK